MFPENAILADNFSWIFKKQRSKSPFEGGLRGMTVGLVILIFLPLQNVIAQQTHTQTIVRTAQFQNPTHPENKLIVHNINGSVEVEGYGGQEIRVTAEQTIDARRARDIDQAQYELQFILEEEGDRIFVYLNAPFIDVKKYDDNLSYRIDDWDRDYEFIYSITIQVPQKTNARASTVNHGHVTIQHISARELSAFNVNGEIHLDNVTGQTKARTVNGDISALYASSPAADSEYKTINGTIEVTYPQGLSADICFKSMHGDLYTDFPNITRLSSQVEKTEERRGNGIAYRVDKFSPIRIGSGGPEYRFEVLNGDVYIKQIKS